MKAILLLLVISIGYSDLPAQDSTLVTLKAGTRVRDVLNPADIYYYPQFTNGKVFFRDGSKAVGKMNYSRLVDQMLFVDHKSDTLALANEQTIKFIAVDRDTFYFDEGYIRLIADYGDVKLAEKQVWVVADTRKIGTHNRSTSTVTVTSLSSYTDDAIARAKSYDLIINEDVLIRRETHYFFGDEYNRFARAGKKKLLLLFPKDELSLENYLKENKVNFDKKDDLERLAQFLSQLH
jgi:hypothetical protein